MRFLLLQFGLVSAYNNAEPDVRQVCGALAEQHQNMACCGGGDEKAFCAAPDLRDEMKDYLSHHPHGYPQLDGPTVRTPKVKMSSLSYMNSAGRAGFDFNTHFNDFTNEGHMYPVHGVGDLDQSSELLSRFIKSTEGKAFKIVDLDLDIQVAEDTGIPVENAYIDFHVIPTKHLDGSTRLADGSRPENHIKYFNPKVDKVFGENKIDWISGNAMLDSTSYFGGPLAKPPENIVPTTLASTRATPYLDQDEYLGLTFFSDGPQTRVNNGGQVTNWRYVVPGYDTDIVWFVAQAYVPCTNAEISEQKCTMMETTTGKSVYGRPRTAAETDDLDTHPRSNRLMKTVSTHTVKIKNGYDRSTSFNQRYGNKQVDYGDILMKSPKELKDSWHANWECDSEDTKCKATKLYKKWVVDRFVPNKQIAFYEICDMYVSHLHSEENLKCSPNTKKMEKECSVQYEKFEEMRGMLNTMPSDSSGPGKKGWFDISVESLSTKCLGGKAYLPTPVGETGWMVVEAPHALEVPSGPGEFFIGWSVLNQPSHRLNVADQDALNWAVSHGYKIHQGPGMLYITGGKQSHPGNLEPFLLEHDYFDYDNVAGREKAASIPNVHWRLDTPSVIRRSLDHGAVTETNVGAFQKMLVSVGTQTALHVPSRSPNFLGRYYQKLLSNPALLKDLKQCAKDPTASKASKDLTELNDCNTMTNGDPVYKIVGGDDDAYVYTKNDLKGVWTNTMDRIY